MQFDPSLCLPRSSGATPGRHAFEAAPESAALCPESCCPEAPESDAPLGEPDEDDDEPPPFEPAPLPFPGSVDAVLCAGGAPFASLPS
jgi:hypothetical protein